MVIWKESRHDNDDSFAEGNAGCIVALRGRGLLKFFHTPRMVSVTTDFTTHGGSHIYGLPYPSADSLDQMDHFCTFDVSNIIPKNIHYFPYMTFKPILAYIRGYDPQTRIHRDVCKRPNSFEFSLMWIWVTCLLAFHMPWNRLDLTFHYPIEALYK